MDEQLLRKHCAEHGSMLVSYGRGQGAYLILPSGEHLLISIGATTAKVARRRRFFGWKFPKTVVAKSMSDWDQGFLGYDRMRRFALVSMVLDGLISLIAKLKSIAELELAWCALRNPLEVTVTELWFPPAGSTA